MKENKAASGCATRPRDVPSPIPPSGGERLTGLAPVVSERTVVLVLGSFPGAASLRAGQYYAHPQNHFWRILQALWPQHTLPGAEHYGERCNWLLARGLGLWDVYASCERSGSLDTSIRNAQVKRPSPTMAGRASSMRAARRCWGWRCTGCRRPVRPTPPGVLNVN